MSAAGLDPRQLRDHVVRPALEHIGLWSLAAEQLVMGTAAQESGLRYLAQLGGGPGLGLWQVEPATAIDIWENFLRYQAPLADLVKQLLGVQPGRVQALATNLLYAAAMCRIHYRRDRRALPMAGDVPGMAATWKRHYNTARGKGKPEEFISNWRRLVAPVYGAVP